VAVQARGARDFLRPSLAFARPAVRRRPQQLVRGGAVCRPSAPESAYSRPSRPAPFLPMAPRPRPVREPTVAGARGRSPAPALPPGRNVRAAQRVRLAVRAGVRNQVQLKVHRGVAGDEPGAATAAAGDAQDAHDIRWGESQRVTRTKAAGL
jgi:hypothetical protein